MQAERDLALPQITATTEKKKKKKKEHCSSGVTGSHTGG